MKVQNMTSSRGNSVPNQFIITHAGQVRFGEEITVNGCDVFQSYDSIIAIKSDCNEVYLDSRYWDYSVTTGKYRNQFLGETKKETERKIASGEYILTNLNGWNMIDLTQYGEQELSLHVFNEEYLYNNRHRMFLKDILDDTFIYTDEQWIELQADLEQDAEECA